MNPELLICDEPISALDVSIRAQIINLLNDLKKTRNLSMLFIAHDLSVVKYFCDSICVMYFGDMVEKASSDELFRHPLHPYTRSLLSAIPKPNPLSERRRKRVKYNPAKEHDYTKDKPHFQEVIPNHWVLCNQAELVRYRAEIIEMDKENKEMKNPLHQIHRMRRICISHHYTNRISFFHKLRFLSKSLTFVLFYNNFMCTSIYFVYFYPHFFC